MFPVLLFCLLRGDRVMVFDFEMSLKRSNWLAKLINQGRIKRIFIKPNAKEHGDAIDLAEELFSKTGSRKLPQLISALFKDTETDLIFKKEMVGDIFRWIYISKYLSVFEKSADPSQQHLLILGRTRGNLKYFNLFLPDRSRQIDMDFMPFWAAPFGLAVYASIWAKYYAASVYCIVVYGSLAMLGWLRSPDKSKKTLNFVVAVEQPFLTKFKGQRSYDFLLDDEGINKSNTLFLVGKFASDAWMSEQAANGNHLARFEKMYKPGAFYGVDRQYFNFIMTWHLLKTMVVQFAASSAFLGAFAKSLKAYINCSRLVSQLSFNNYIYTNNESANQIATNIFLRRHGCTTWYYLIFLVGGYPRSKGRNDFSSHRNTLWAFLNPDCLIAMNEDVVGYFRLHRQQVRNYRVLGSIYSEMVRINTESMGREDAVRQYFPRDIGSGKKVCAFFDTTFVDEEEAFASFEDGRRFYEDILKLLDSRNDILVVIKPSKDESFFISPTGQWSSPEKGADIVRLINRLKEHSRVHYAGDAGDIPTIMAMSDVVVTHCMSSTTAEALGARKKAFWYEAGEKHRGLLYDSLPELVVHGYAGLEERIDQLLYRISDKEYDDYLDRYIRGAVESHVDGRALTRFRALLARSRIIV